MNVEDNRVHLLRQIVFFLKILNQDFRGLSDQKLLFFLLFWPFLQNGSMDLPNSVHACRGQQGPSFEADGFSEKFLILDYKGLSV